MPEEITFFNTTDEAENLTEDRNEHAIYTINIMFYYTEQLAKVYRTCNIIHRHPLYATKHILDNF